MLNCSIKNYSKGIQCSLFQLILMQCGKISTFFFKLELIKKNSRLFLFVFFIEYQIYFMHRKYIDLNEKM